MERLQKVIASAGVCSRRKAEDLIKDGKVKVNGIVCDALGTKVELTDDIEIDGVKLAQEKKVYYVLNKPINCVTTLQDTHGRMTVMDCFHNIPYRIFPVGRLDYDTTGVLLFTNDGDLDNKLIHPRYQIMKTYLATCRGKLDDGMMHCLMAGVELDDGLAKAIAAEIVHYDYKTDCTECRIIVGEGRKHLVKKMVMAIDSTVVSLNRESFAGITTTGLKRGEYRELTATEIAMLRK